MEREGEHAAQLGGKIQAVHRIGVQDGLRIRVGPRLAALRTQRRIQLDVVVDLAVGRQRELTVGRDHRLMPGGEPDDRQPCLRQPDRAVAIDAVIVRAAVGQGRGHPA